MFIYVNDQGLFKAVPRRYLGKIHSYRGPWIHLIKVRASYSECCIEIPGTPDLWFEITMTELMNYKYEEITHHNELINCKFLYFTEALGVSSLSYLWRKGRYHLTAYFDKPMSYLTLTYRTDINIAYTKTSPKRVPKVIATPLITGRAESNKKTFARFKEILY